MDYKVIDYQESFKNDVLAAIDQGYKDIGYSGIEIGSLDYDLSDIAKYYPKPSIFKLVLDNNQLIATYAVKIQGSKAELKRVYVKESHRGKGLAKQLSNDAFEYVRGLGLNSLNIWSGTKCTHAHKLYQDLGAIQTNDTRELGGIDSVVEKHFVKKFS